MELPRRQRSKLVLDAALESRLHEPEPDQRGGRGAERDAGWMADVMGREVNVPEEIYAQEAAESLRAAGSVLGRLIRTG